MRIRHTSVIAALGLLYAASVSAAAVTPFTVWNMEARHQIPLWVQWWLYWMFFISGVGLFFVYRYVPARWALGAFLTGHILGALEILSFGADHFLVGMVALNHVIVMTPAVIYLGWQFRKYPFKPWFGIWMRIYFATFCFSLIFDYRDAAIYLSKVLK